GFTILPLDLPNIVRTKSSDAKSTTPPRHYLYVKPHEPSSPTPTSDRSLFIANIPIDAAETNIRALFAEQLGGLRVVAVEFDSSIPAAQVVKRFRGSSVQATAVAQVDGDKNSRKRKRDEEIVAEGVVEDEESALPRIWGGDLRASGSTAVVTFVDRSSMKGAFAEIRKVAKAGGSVRWQNGEGLGLERYTAHNSLKYPSKAALQSSINAYLTQFNRAENARNRVRKVQRSVPDEDGFMTVVRGGRIGPARVEEAEKKKAELEERNKRNGIKEDFYRFQTREKRKEAEGELRRKFEMDRKRVVEMRERRGRVRPET
ncbi:hypothetical protein P154DRAFT_411582, partial [Amniculicola lignicola CBS 123094]